MKEVTLSYWELREPGEGSLQSSLAGGLWGWGLGLEFQRVTLWKLYLCGIFKPELSHFKAGLWGRGAAISGNAFIGGIEGSCPKGCTGETPKFYYSGRPSIDLLYLTGIYHLWGQQKSLDDICSSFQKNKLFRKNHCSSFQKNKKPTDELRALKNREKSFPHFLSLSL